MNWKVRLFAGGVVALALLAATSYGFYQFFTNDAVFQQGIGAFAGAVVALGVGGVTTYLGLLLNRANKGYETAIKAQVHLYDYHQIVQDNIHQIVASVADLNNKSPEVFLTLRFQPFTIEREFVIGTTNVFFLNFFFRLTARLNKVNTDLRGLEMQYQTLQTIHPQLSSPDTPLEVIKWKRAQYRQNILAFQYLLLEMGCHLTETERWITGMQKYANAIAERESPVLLKLFKRWGHPEIEVLQKEAAAYSQQLEDSKDLSELERLVFSGVKLKSQPDFELTMLFNGERFDAFKSKYKQ